MLDLETCLLGREGVVVEDKEEEEEEEGLASCPFDIFNFDMASFEIPFVLGIVGGVCQYFDATVRFVVLDDMSNDGCCH